MSDTTVNTSGGIGFLGMLTILFIGLKLTGYITWSWVWVLAPIWIPMVIILGIIVIVGLVLLVLWIIKNVLELRG